MRFYIISLLSVLCLSLPLSNAVHAARSVSLFDLRLALNKGRDVGALRNALNLDEIRQTYQGPEEPVLPQVVFYTYDRPIHIQGQVESLVHGVTIGLPPEYDHYGYELRRYMKSVGNWEVYKNSTELETQRLNIKKARVIFSHWRRKLNGEIRSVGKRIELENGDSKSRTTFKLNAGIIKAFTIETQSWLNANEALLDFLAERKKYYRVDGYNLVFREDSDRAIFLSLYTAREKARHQMHRYNPFRIDIY